MVCVGKIGKPGIDGQKVLIKIPRNLLAEIDTLWPKPQYVSRNDFIRRALWEKVQRVKLLSEKIKEVAAPCS
ncbi:MAG: ribbon-helix-helix domain-containing protein [Candidatus Methanomethyliaceae archaeon]|nr:ribbon-helix-helix domain-containing protein [Candidatus Methanomethyliaceae archaeon]